MAPVSQHSGATLDHCSRRCRVTTLDNLLTFSRFCLQQFLYFGADVKASFGRRGTTDNTRRMFTAGSTCWRTGLNDPTISQSHPVMLQRSALTAVRGLTGRVLRPEGLSSSNSSSSRLKYTVYRARSAIVLPRINNVGP